MNFFDAHHLDLNAFRLFGIFAFPLAVGLFSGFTHCAAMCGPIHLFLARSGTRNGLALYHLGRVTTYGILGAVAGSIGQSFHVRGAGWIWIALYVLMALKLLGVPLWPGSWEAKYSGWILNKIRPLTSGADSRNSATRFLPLGLAAGFLPCATTQAGFVWSAGTANAWTGALGMLLLGAGTLPLFLAFPRKWFPAKRGAYHVALGVGLLVLASWRVHGLLFANPYVCH